MNVIELLEECNVPYKLVGQDHHVTNGWVGVACPTCDGLGSDTHHLGINLNSLACSCWKCGTKPFLATLAEITRLPYHQIETLAGPLRKTAPAKRVEVRGVLRIPAGVEPLLGPHKKYLRKRGFDPDQLSKLWNVQGIGLAAKLAWRIWIPVSYQGQVVSWTTRGISDTARRYVSADKNEEAYPAKKLLFGADFVRHAAVVCEGPLDAMAVGPGAVATMGVNYTQSQVAKLSKFPVVAVCFDAEPDAQRRARRLCDELKAFGGQVWNVVLESGKDAASASKKEIRELRRRFLD